MFYQWKSLGRFKRKYVCSFSRYFFISAFVNAKIKSVTAWKVLFYGTDQLSEVTLKALVCNRLSNDGSKVIQSLEIVCKQTDCAVRQYATLKNLPIHTWPFDVPPDVYDVGIVVSFGHMIPSSSIFACKYGIINAHPSLLPRWRGAAPIFHTILNGDSQSGVTITQVSPNKFDVGNILMQEHYAVPERCTAKKLTADLSRLAADMVLTTLKKLPQYIESSYPQPTEGVTLARKIKPHKCSINWTEDSSVVVDRKFRAYDGYFDVYTTWKGFKIALLDIATPEEVREARMSTLVTDPVSPGYCFYHKKRKLLFVKCQDGWNGIKLMRVPKRGRITALDFYNGFVSKEEPDKRYFV